MSSYIDLLREKLQKAGRQIPYFLRGLALIWEAASSWTIAWFVLLLLQGLIPIALVYLTKFVVDSLVEVIRAPSPENVRLTVMLIVAMVVVLVLKEMLRSLTSLIRTSQADLVNDYISGLIHAKSAEIDLAYYDSPEYYDRLHRARTGASYRTLAMMEGAGALLQNAITLIAMVVVLLPYGVWLPVALLLSTLPAFYVVLHHRLRMHHWYVGVTPVERRASYYDWLLTARESAGEVRLFQLSELFRSMFQNLRRQLRLERLRLMRDQARAEIGASLSALVFTGLAMAWMIWRTIMGQLTLGDLALFYQAFNQGQGMMRSLLENVGEIYSNSLFLVDLFEFLALQSDTIEPAEPALAPERLKSGIQFLDVSFSYPQSRHLVLEHFNLIIPAGQIAAVVGPNGAGKSTLVKLLCRFYDPQQGSILIDGVDVRRFSLEELRSRITVLFQEPMHYNATVRENIELGDLSPQLDMEQVETAARAAGAHNLIQQLPSGYETLLGKWFQGGTELSVGEWQRIALARAFLRQAPIIVLDEPTSAMDPWAEAEWLERFRSLTAGRTAILITHRITTAAFADVIYVMEQGQVVESGRHQDLLAGGGRYATAWAGQRQPRPEIS